jgi:ElaB/YqjD/DUF883 family membrane-anchored ribosome-binding protein
MDAVQELPEQNAAEMRHDINTTRSAMADKLETLENKMLDSVQSAHDTVKDSLQSAKDTVASVKRTFDLKHQVEQRPWTMVGGCFLAGLVVGHLFPRDRPKSYVENVSITPAAPMPRQAEPPSRPGVLEPFQQEIDKVKEIAIGYVMGLVRDSIKESVPQLASKIDDLMNGLTTKLGGEPAQRQSP